MAAKYGTSGSKLAAAASGGASSSADADEVEVMGEKTRAERDAELRRDAVSLDDDAD